MCCTLACLSECEALLLRESEISRVSQSVCSGRLQDQFEVANCECGAAHHEIDLLDFAPINDDRDMEKNAVRRREGTIYSGRG